MYNKTCECGTKFVSTGPAGKYCESCKEIADTKQRLKNRERAEARRRKEGRRIGRGQLPGEAHANYKHGYYVAQAQSKAYREKVRFCERCGVDTYELSRWHWVMHHKDNDHSNHTENNLELLCKRCHQIEHNCVDNLKVQRPSREGVESSDSKRLAP